MLILLAGLIHCGQEIPFPEEFTLKRPVGLSVTPLPGAKYSIQYTVQNQELTFDGYNLLISRISISDGEAASMVPLILNGSVPTFLHNYTQFDPNTTITVVVDRFIYPQTYEPGTTYFFRLQAHSRKGVRSLSSNEAWGVALP